MSREILSKRERREQARQLDAARAKSVREFNDVMRKHRGVQIARLIRAESSFTVSAVGHGESTSKDFLYRATAIGAAEDIRRYFPTADVTVTEFFEEWRSIIWRNGKERKQHDG